MKRVLIVMDEVVARLVGRKTPDAESVRGVDIPLGVASGSLVWNLGATPHVTVCGALGKGVGFLDIIEGNGEGDAGK